MSHKIYNALREISEPVGCPIRKGILLVLSQYADDFGRCWPSQGTIARVTEYSIASVKRKLLELEADGWLSREYQRSGTRIIGTIYRLNIDRFGIRENPKTDNYRLSEIPKTQNMNVTDGIPENPKNSFLVSDSAAYGIPQNPKQLNNTKDKRESPLGQHPLIEALSKITGRTPPKTSRQLLVQKVGKDEIDIPRLTGCVQTWVARGYNPTNFDGITDWYLTGIPGRGGVNGKNGQQRSDRRDEEARTRARLADEIRAESRINAS